MKTLATLCIILAATLLTGCTQWGTPITAGNSDAGVWWACPDRGEPCSDGLLQRIQMDNTCAAARRDLARAETWAVGQPKKLARLREALSAASEARARVGDSEVWDDDLADYTLWCVRAERAALDLLPRKATIYP